MGISLVLTSLAAGIWAHDQAQAEALGGWLRAHPPSNGAWQHALGSRGYHWLEDPKALQRASRLLPALVDEEGSVWTSRDANWIAVYQKQTGGLASMLFCLECTLQAEGWQPSGRGWDAFDPVLARADLRKAQLPPVPKRQVAFSDPKELRY